MSEDIPMVALIALWAAETTPCEVGVADLS
jgi:hypothetical protein